MGQRLFNSLALFGSMGTLLCCALPALMVALGAGAALAGLVGAVPQLIWLSAHKVPLFIFSAIMLSLAGYAQWRARFAPCPTDPALARACTRLRRRSRMVYVISLTCFATGFFFAFIAPYLMR